MRRTSTGDDKPTAGKTAAVEKSEASKTRFFAPKREPSNPNLEQHFRNFAGDVNALDKVIKLFRACEIDPMSVDDEGDDSLHYAALAGNTAFFDFILTDPIAKKTADINSFNLQRKTVPLSLAISNYHFDLALKLIQNYGADIHAIVRGQSQGKITTSFGILRKALAQYYCPSFKTFTPEFKLSLENLCLELIKRGLSFFETAGSFCPPAFELLSRPILFTNESEVDMKRLRLNKNQYTILKNLGHLQNCSETLFDLLHDEAKKLKDTNPEAQNILDILNHHTLTDQRKLLKSTPHIS